MTGLCTEQSGQSRTVRCWLDGHTTQGGVFLLQKADGSVDPDQVLKVVFKFGIGGLFGMTNLEREWRVGRHLALLTEPGEALPGFMGTGAGIVTKSGKFRGETNASCSAQTFCWPHSYGQIHSVQHLYCLSMCFMKYAKC